MRLFLRLLIGFAGAGVVTALSQFLFFLANPDLRLLEPLIMSDRQIVRMVGADAVAAIQRQDRKEAVHRLEVLEEHGLRASLVTNRQIVSSSAPDSDAIRAAQTALRTGQESRTFRSRTLILHVNGERAALAISVAPRPTLNIVGRALLLILVPIGVSLGLSWWLAAPLIHLRDAVTRIGRGDLSARVGDISGYREVKDLAQSFDTMAAQVERMVSRQRRMLADVSHEVRSPLARLRLGTELLRQGRTDTSQQLNRLERDIDRLDELVEALSAVIVAENNKPRLEPLQLDELVADVTDAVTPSADEANVKIEVALEPVRVEGDRRMLVSAIENVLRNALRYSPPGSTISIRLDSQPPTLSITDQGPGVAVEHLDSIFTPFFRTSESRDRKEGGLGLGLAIVHEAIAAHGGHVWAENASPHGLRVTLALPPTP